MRSLSRIGCSVATLLLAVAPVGAQQLVHHWAFDEPLGFRQTFTDSSGNGHTGTGAGDIVPGKFGNAVYLLPGSDPATGGIGDGVDWVDPSPSSTALPVEAADSWSINLWAKIDADLGALKYLGGFGIDDGENDDTERSARSVISFAGEETASFHFWGASVDLNSGRAIYTDDQWHMYSVTYDGASTDMHLYLDGLQVASTTFGGSGPFIDAPAEVHVGNPSNWNEDFTGALDEFAIYDGALAPAQVGGLFLANDPGQPQELQPFAEVDRDTGEVILRNGTQSNIDNLVGYRILSEAGSLDASEWMPIAGRLDNGGGIDPGPWAVDEQTDYALSETDQGTPAGSLSAGALVEFGAVWLKSPTEDIAIELLTQEGDSLVTTRAIIEYVGNGGAAFQRSDLNADGVIDVHDWSVFASNGFSDLSGYRSVEAYQRGDLDGDGDNDRLDYRLFKADYIAANSAAAFAALTNPVPEPTTVWLASLVSVLAGCSRRGR